MKRPGDWNLFPKLLLAGLAMLLLIILPQIYLENHFWTKIVDNSEIQRIAWSIRNNMLHARHAEKGFLLEDAGAAVFRETGSSANLKRHQMAMAAVKQDIAALSRFSGMNPEIDVALLQKLTDTYQRAFGELVQDCRESQTAVNLAQESILLESMNRAGDGVQPIIESIVTEATRRATESHADYELMLRGVGVASVSLAALLFYIFARSVTSPLQQLKKAALDIGKGNLETNIGISSRDEVGVLAGSFSEMTGNLLQMLHGVKTSGIQVTSSSTSVAAAAKQLQTSVTEQTIATRAVVSAAKQISEHLRDLLGTMSEIRNAAEDARSLAEAGQMGLVTVEDRMQSLTDAMQRITSPLASLSEKATNIGTVVKVVSKVADQTHLLSINAAIEAEKAAEAGSGFSVVAEEIRRLADQTAESALSIEHSVSEMQFSVTSGISSIDQFMDMVREGVERMHEVSVHLNKIIENVQAITPRFESINETMQSQSKKADQISESVVHLHEGARQTTESVSELNRVAEQLNYAARMLQAEVSRFRVSR